MTFKHMHGTATDAERLGYYLMTPEKSEDPRYPFQRIVHANGSSTGVIALAAPFYARTFYRVSIGPGAGVSLCGICPYVAA